ncbi:hypothetical protein [Streptomyces sp. NPDC087294]|uniref:hypothetical protein n=1 Tax=Streptomyces sp. NPDC087294 TaxID=3365777 RepID=UPI00381A5895
MSAHDPNSPDAACAFAGCCARRSTRVRLIDPRVPELARSLTLFQYVQAVTGGRVAHIDQAGSYAPPTLRGEAFTVHPGEITLRVDGAGIDAAVVTRDAEDTVAIHLLDHQGRTIHRGRLLSEGDRLLAGLTDTIEAGTTPTAPPAPPAVPPWENGDQLTQLDAILTDGGLARRAEFHNYRAEHREIALDVVPAVLDHVCSVGLPIGVGVFAPSVMQASYGPVHVTDRTLGGRVFAALAHSSVEFDLTAVHACHLVRSTAAHGPTSALELDDEEGRCVAVITQFGMVGADVHGAWEDLASSLPDA